MLLENRLEFNVHEINENPKARTVTIKKLYFGRYCGRNIDATRAFLDSYRTQGYSVHGNPDLCRKSRYLLTNEDAVEVQGPQTSGEVEIVAIVDSDEVLVSVGSDHNDRTIETMWADALGKVYDTAKQKQMVPTVVARDASKYEEIRDHWDRLNLRSYVTVSGKKIPY